MREKEKESERQGPRQTDSIVRNRAIEESSSNEKKATEWEKYIKLIFFYCSLLLYSTSFSSALLLFIHSWHLAHTAVNTNNNRRTGLLFFFMCEQMHIEHHHHFIPPGSKWHDLPEMQTGCMTKTFSSKFSSWNDFFLYF